ENGDGNRKGEIDADGDHREDDEDDRLAVTRGPMRSFAAGVNGWESDEVAHLPFGFASSFLSPDLPALESAAGSEFSSSSASLTVVSTILTLALSSRPRPPTITTSSPGLAPLRICILSPSRTPSRTRRRRPAMSD